MNYIEFINKLAKHRLEFMTYYDENLNTYNIAIILSNKNYFINETDSQLMEEVWLAIKSQTGITED